MSDRPADMDDRHAGGAPAPWFGRRKRIVAREVPRDPARDVARDPTVDLKSSDVIDPPPRAAASHRDSVLDPTLFSERQRKRGHNFGYRLAQLTTLACILTAALSIAWALLDHRRRAQGLAAGACLLAMIDFRLVKLSRLAYRLRGYVAAGCVLATI